TISSVAAVALPPVGAFLDDVAYPEQGLKVVDERRQSKQSDLERVRRLVPRQATLSFQAFQKRGFLAADVSACAAPQVHCRAARRQLCDLARQQLVRSRILVAQVDIHIRRIDDMRCNQRAFEKTMSIAQQVEPILESPGL